MSTIDNLQRQAEKKQAKMDEINARIAQEREAARDIDLGDTTADDSRAARAARQRIPRLLRRLAQ